MTAPNTMTAYVAVADDIYPATVTGTDYDGVLPLTAPVPSREVLDPWRVVQTGQSQEQQDWFVQHAGSTYEFHSDENSHGVFLDASRTEIDTTLPYYAFRAPSLLAWSGSDWQHAQCLDVSNPPECAALSEGDLVFADWVASSSSGQPTALLPADPRTWYPYNWNFNTTAAIFKQSNAGITARYKAHMLSSTPVNLSESEGPTGVNSQRKVDAGNGLHAAVYESAGEIWYVESADSGTTWSAELRLSNGTGVAMHPSIFRLGDKSLVAWLEDGNIRVGKVVADPDGQCPWKKMEAYSYSVCTGPTSDAAPVLAATRSAWQTSQEDYSVLVVYEGSGGKLRYLWFDSGQLTTEDDITNSENGRRPSLAHDYERFANSYEPEFHLAWVNDDGNGPDIFYSKMVAAISPFSLTQNPAGGNISGSRHVSSAPSITCNRGVAGSSPTYEVVVAYSTASGTQSDIKCWVQSANAPFPAPITIAAATTPDTIWAPSVMCLQRQASSSSQYDNIRCAFNTSASNGETWVRSVWYDLNGWSNPTDQAAISLHPSLVAFPTSGEELDVYSQRASTFAEGITTVQCTRSSLTKSRNAEYNANVITPSMVSMHFLPNPTMGNATLVFHIPDEGDVEIRLVDVLGKMMLKPIRSRCTAGAHALILEMNALPTGTYFCRLRYGSKILTSKLILLQR